MDSHVSQTIAVTHGRMYAGLTGRLARYPIPRWPWNAPAGTAVLDLGCGWGRWTLAAAAAGCRAVGVDRSLPAVQAARRVARELGRDQAAHFVCADLDHLPFRPAVFDQAIAYGVWQYLPRQGEAALREAINTLRPHGVLRLQLPHRGGLRTRWFRLLARCGRPRETGVQYWTLAQMRQWAALQPGPPATENNLRLRAEGYFSTNAQWDDRDLLPRRYRCLVAASRLLCRCSRRWPALLALADAVWLEWTVPPTPDHPARFPSTAPASAAKSCAPSAASSAPAG